MKRAAKQTGRPTAPERKELIIAFGAYRFKQYTKQEWELVRHPAWCALKHEGPQTMICIALEDLGPDNGFPFDLSYGEDACIDGTDDLLLPPTGGGAAILIWIGL